VRGFSPKGKPEICLSFTRVRRADQPAVILNEIRLEESFEVQKGKYPIQRVSATSRETVDLEKGGS